jgi:hypothetical protein
MGVSCLRIEPIIDMENSYRREFYPGLWPFQSGCREIVPQLLGRWVRYVLMPTKSALSGALDPDEWMAMKMHAAHSETILSRIAAFRGLAPIAAAHHERLDGNGYPC